ncbi:hypothetical protein [Staphylococcus phage vB_SsapH-Golestan-100]|nr:hypothetical protein [Staphylococcus phage vB_SsapH-Golestan-100]
MLPFFTRVKKELEAKGYTVTDNTEEGFFVAENSSKVYTIDYKNEVLEELDDKGQLHIQDINSLDITEAEIKVAS